MEKATAELNDIKAASGSMLPEDRVARTMDLQEDIAAKIEIIKKNAEVEKGLLPQGDKVDKDAQAFKDELARITKYVTDLDANTKTECNKYSNDVKYWAEYRTGIKEFTPWLLQAEKAAGEGLIKPSSLDDTQAALVPQWRVRLPGPCLYQAWIPGVQQVCAACHSMR